MTLDISFQDPDKCTTNKYNFDFRDPEKQTSITSKLIENLQHPGGHKSTGYIIVFEENGIPQAEFDLSEPKDIKKFRKYLKMLEKTDNPILKKFAISVLISILILGIQGCGPLVIGGAEAVGEGTVGAEGVGAEVITLIRGGMTVSEITEALEEGTTISELLERGVTVQMLLSTGRVSVFDLIESGLSVEQLVNELPLETLLQGGIEDKELLEAGVSIEEVIQAEKQLGNIAEISKLPKKFKIHISDGFIDIPRKNGIGYLDKNTFNILKWEYDLKPVKEGSFFDSATIDSSGVIKVITKTPLWSISTGFGSAIIEQGLQNLIQKELMKYLTYLQIENILTDNSVIFGSEFITRYLIGIPIKKIMINKFQNPYAAMIYSKIQNILFIYQLGKGNWKYIEENFPDMENINMVQDKRDSLLTPIKETVVYDTVLNNYKSIVDTINSVVKNNNKGKGITDEIINIFDTDNVQNKIVNMLNKYTYKEYHLKDYDKWLKKIFTTDYVKKNRIESVKIAKKLRYMRDYYLVYNSDEWKKHDILYSLVIYKLQQFFPNRGYKYHYPTHKVFDINKKIYKYNIIVENTKNPEYIRLNKEKLINLADKLLGLRDNNEKVLIYSKQWYEIDMLYKTLVNNLNKVLSDDDKVDYISPDIYNTINNLEEKFNIIENKNKKYILENESKIVSLAISARTLRDEKTIYHSPEWKKCHHIYIGLIKVLDKFIPNKYVAKSPKSSFYVLDDAQYTINQLEKLKNRFDSLEKQYEQYKTQFARYIKMYGENSITDMLKVHGDIIKREKKIAYEEYRHLLSLVEEKGYYRAGVAYLKEDGYISYVRFKVSYKKSHYFTSLPTEERVRQRLAKYVPKREEVVIRDA